MKRLTAWLKRAARRESDAPNGGHDLVFRTYINHAFKVYDGEMAHFASVFIGSNDFPNIDRFDEIVDHLRAMQPRHKLTLVTFIGGMGFLKFLERIRWDRIVVADFNIAEHAKAAYLLRQLARMRYEEFDGFRGLEAMLRADPNLLLPRLGEGCHEFLFGGDAVFDYEGRRSPAVPILPVSAYPEYEWRPDRAGFERTQDNIRRAMERWFHVAMPAIDAEGSFVTAFLSNAPPEALPAPAVRAKMGNAAGVIPAWSFFPNDEALNPHPYWEAEARRLLRGRSMHVWSDEDAALIGGEYDRLTEWSCRLCEAPERAGGECATVLFHIVLGKCADASLRASRLDEFERALASAGRHAARVVIAEFNRDTETGAERAWMSVPEISAVVERTLAPLHFRHTETTHTPGGGELRRNAFLVFDRI